MPKNELIKKLEAIIREADHMKKSYFWRSPSLAGERRGYEKRHSHEEITWTENGSDWSARYDVRCTCQNVYASGTYTRDGRKTTLTAVKNSLLRMQAAAENKITDGLSA